MATIKKAYIFGSSGHAHVIASILHGKFNEIIFVDRFAISNEVLAEEMYFQKIDTYSKIPVFIGIGDNAIRKEIFLKLKKFQITPANCISDFAFIAPDASIGNGVVICPGSVVGSQAQIQDNCIVNTLSSVDHDCYLGEHSQITAGVNFGGNTKSGNNTFFGIKSATIPNVTIGDNVVVMAGSLICNDIPANVMVGGIPAKVVKQL